MLTECCKEPTHRFYTWARPTLSLGRHQKKVSLNRQFLRENNIDFVVRPTGGRAVLHWDELTYAVILPIEHPKAKGSFLQTYLVISERIATALCKLRFRRENRASQKIEARKCRLCFDVSSSYEITIDKKDRRKCADENSKKQLQNGSIVFK